jgi:hypothetical protein
VTEDSSDRRQHGPQLTTRQARQGRSGRSVVVVLVVSTVLVILAFAAIWLRHAPALSGPGGQTRAAVKAGSTPIMPARQTPEQPPPSTPIAK